MSPCVIWIKAYERAAASLGASPLRVLATITLPLLLPGLISGWLFAAILSFNEFTASLFVTAQRTQTLPVAMYNYVRGVRRSFHGGTFRHVHRRHRRADYLCERVSGTRQGAEY